MVLDFWTPKPAHGCVFGEKHTSIHQNARSSKSILDSQVKCNHDADIIKRVKCNHDANIIKLTSVAQSIWSGKFILEPFPIYSLYIIKLFLVKHFFFHLQLSGIAFGDVSI